MSFGRDIQLYLLRFVLGFVHCFAFSSHRLHTQDYEEKITSGQIGGAACTTRQREIQLRSQVLKFILLSEQ